MGTCYDQILSCLCFVREPVSVDNAWIFPCCSTRHDARFFILIARDPLLSFFFLSSHRHSMKSKPHDASRFCGLFGALLFPVSPFFPLFPVFFSVPPPQNHFFSAPVIPKFLTAGPPRALLDFPRLPCDAFSSYLIPRGDLDSSARHLFPCLKNTPVLSGLFCHLRRSPHASPQPRRKRIAFVCSHEYTMMILDNAAFSFLRTESSREPMDLCTNSAFFRPSFLFFFFFPPWYMRGATSPAYSSLVPNGRQSDL